LHHKFHYPRRFKGDGFSWIPQHHLNRRDEKK
jgi:hypothetical protein